VGLEQLGQLSWSWAGWAANCSPIYPLFFNHSILFLLFGCCTYCNGGPTQPHHDTNVLLHATSQKKLLLAFLLNMQDLRIIVLRREENRNNSNLHS
jgi:hypothetical protein